MPQWKCLTPVVRQCIVTAGVSMNMAGAATVTAYAAGMLPQLRRPDAEILVDESTGSWIASIPGISSLLANFLAAALVPRMGRRSCTLFSVSMLMLGWFCIALAPNIPVILLGRFIQGLNMGSSLHSGPALIAEYSSPKHRGAFLMTISVLCAVFVLTTHVTGSVLSWRANAIIGMVVSIANLPLVVVAPESPTWLAEKGRYDDCKKAFRWLRGDGEEEELKAIINASVIANRVRTEVESSTSFITNFRNKVENLKETIVKKDFYKPIIIMVHLYAIGQWGGINVISSYSNDMLHHVIGENGNVALHIGVLDCQRLVTNLLAMYIVRKVKRRTMLYSTLSLNVVAFLALAGYVFVMTRNIFECQILGLVLLHIHMFSVASGSLPLPFIIAGEIFPLKYKSIGGGICVVAFAVNFFVNVKTAPFLFRTIGFYGAYCLYAVVVGYCLFVVYLLLPETKDRTLQDIEEDFTENDKNVPLEEVRAAQSLMKP